MSETDVIDVDTTTEDVRKVTTVGESLTMSYYVCQPGRWTFQSDKIRGWLQRHLRGSVLNACAGKSFLDHDDVIRNDLDSDRAADTHHDVREIAAHFEAGSFDTIVYDPPFNDRQAVEKYDGQTIGPKGDAQAKRQFHQLLRPGGRVVQFGYSSTCMPGELGYSREAVAVFNAVGPATRNDVLGVVDRRLNGDITEVVRRD